MSLGYYLEGSEDKTAFELKPATDEAFGALWFEDTVHLKKGVTVFYLTGDGVTCEMSFELSLPVSEAVTYAGAFPRK